MTVQEWYARPDRETYMGCIRDRIGGKIINMFDELYKLDGQTDWDLMLYRKLSKG